MKQITNKDRQMATDDKHFKYQFSYKEELYKELDQHYKTTIKRLDGMFSDGFPSGGRQIFRCDNSFNGIVAPNHIMMKLDRPLKKDGYVYEFLVEYECGDTNTGIYFGCKVLDPSIVETLRGNEPDKKEIAESKTKKLIDMADREWNGVANGVGVVKHGVKEALVKLLNNAFPGKRFDLRFLYSDNANDGTYWPFWIRLHEDEDAVDVAARAVRIIKNTYSVFFSPNGGEDYFFPSPSAEKKVEKRGRKKTAPVAPFTQDAYEAGKHELASKSESESCDLDEIIHELLNKKYIFRENRVYERAYILTAEIDIDDLANQIAELYHKRVNSGIKRTPWKAFDNLLLSSSWEPLHLADRVKQKRSYSRGRGRQ